jgi:hypothetical protein
MVLDAYRGIDSALPRRAVGKMIFAARKLFHKLGLSSDVFCNTVIYECVRVN